MMRKSLPFVRSTLLVALSFLPTWTSTYIHNPPTSTILTTPFQVVQADPLSSHCPPSPIPSFSSSSSPSPSASPPLPPWSSSGYILYCPCMGRFGNQLSHLLGSLSFSLSLNRTLILPPFIFYRPYNTRSFLPFSAFFDVERVREYGKVVEQREWMRGLEEEEGRWKKEERRAWCWGGGGKRGEGEKECQMRRGQPSTDFWDLTTFSPPSSPLTFSSSIPHRLTFSSPSDWLRLYPSSLYPVLAFGGAPASFPVRKKDREVQRYVEWNREVKREVRGFIEGERGGGGGEEEEEKGRRRRKKGKLKRPFLGVHLRNGDDWRRSCQNAIGQREYMDSSQCLSPSSSVGITSEMCLPNAEESIERIGEVVRRYGIRSVFVATDANGLVEEVRGKMREIAEEREKEEGKEEEEATDDIEENLNRKKKKKKRNYSIPVRQYTPDTPHMDLAILCESDVFLGNCISSFTGFVTRYRDVNNKGTSLFFGVEEDEKGKEEKAKKKKERKKKEKTQQQQQQQQQQQPSQQPSHNEL